MRRHARIAWLCCLLAGAPHAEDALVGRTLPPYPDGLRDLQGTCLSDPADAGDVARICDYAIAVLGRIDDPAREATFVHVVAQRHLHDEGNLPHWMVTDVLPYPRAEAGEYLQVGTCRVGGVDDGQVAALVRHAADVEYSRDVAWARRLDLATGRFAVLDPRRVDCLHEGMGE